MAGENIKTKKAKAAETKAAETKAKKARHAAARAKGRPCPVMACPTCNAERAKRRRESEPTARVATLVKAHKSGAHVKRKVGACPKCKTRQVRSVASSAFETNRRRH